MYYKYNPNNSIYKDITRMNVCIDYINYQLFMLKI